MARILEHDIDAAEGTIAARTLIPQGPILGLIAYYHGGGWTLGGLAESELLGRSLADATHCAVTLIDYRLAPEHRFPTAVNDAWAALVWIADHLETLVGVCVPLIVAGDSAGGNLAAVLTQRARAAAAPDVALQILVYPATDSDLDRFSYHEPENQLLIGRDTMAWFWDHYAPDPNLRDHPEAAPIRATDLSGLPPAIILTAEYDPLRDEAQAYSQRLSASGVAVREKHFHDQMHGFFTLVGLPGSRAALAFIAAEIDRFFLASTPKGH